MTQSANLIWAAAALALLVLGLSLGNVPMLTGAVFLLLSVLLSTALPTPSGILVRREIPRATCWVGDTLPVRRVVASSAGIGPIFVHDRLPLEAEVVEGSNFRVVWKWPGRRSFDVSYVVRFPKRGVYQLSPPGWESQPPFAAIRGAPGGVGEPFELSVVPRIRNVTRLNRVRARRRFIKYQDDLAHTGASTDEFKEIRQYQPGDSFKRINWKASARMATLGNLPLVNELEPETRRAVWIFLDVANHMDVGVPLANPLESTVEAAGTLAQYYLSRGSTLGACAFNSTGGSGELLPPEAGKRQFNRLMDMLAGLRPGPAEQDLLQSVERCKDFLYRFRPDVFIITRLDVQYARPGEDAASLERFKTAVGRLIALKSQSRASRRVRVLHVAPQEAERAYNGLSVARWEARDVARELRSKGASVIEWEPVREEFTSVLVRHIEAYA
ncbi:MAG: DUF58 domain-containing protein [Chloroflexota bacterium]|nr:DUF58 domain-containing protein [Dehalococcoidia bacterium]MDE2901087.1 DUF58 domain-containing protein [Chloroflexota bacterium]